MTDMEVPIKGRLLTYQGLPPRDRMSLEGAQRWFLNIWTGKQTLSELFWELGCYNVVMLFPERSAHHLTDLALFIKNLAQLYCAQKHGLAPSEWTCGMIFNAHRFPLGEHGQEQT